VRGERSACSQGGAALYKKERNPERRWVKTGGIELGRRRPVASSKTCCFGFTPLKCSASEWLSTPQSSRNSATSEVSVRFIRAVNPSMMPCAIRQSSCGIASSILLIKTTMSSFLRNLSFPCPYSMLTLILSPRNRGGFSRWLSPRHSCIAPDPCACLQYIYLSKSLYTLVYRKHRRFDVGSREWTRCWCSGCCKHLQCPYSFI
jgi:hypothetical protein